MENVGNLIDVKVLNVRIFVEVRQDDKYYKIKIKIHA